MEIDLQKPVATDIWINDHWHPVIYESLHLICVSYGHYGHVSRECTKKQQEDDSLHGKCQNV